MLVIGSTALSLFFKERGFSFREPVDLDVMCSLEEMKELARQAGLGLTQIADYKWTAKDTLGPIEFEIFEQSESARLYNEYVRSNFTEPELTSNPLGTKIRAVIAPLEVLYSIKMSHRHYPRSWKKHIEDLMRMRPFVGVDSLLGITLVREKETAVREGKLKTPSLNKSAAEFFDDNVSNRTFVHDRIHEIMAHQPRPMFEYIKKDVDKVACSKEKFWALPTEDRIRCVLEEAYVIALERCVIPMLFESGKPVSAGDAFDWAIMRICTTLTSGWFREFATLSYDDIMRRRDPQYVEKFLRAYEDGRIKKIKG